MLFYSLEESFSRSHTFDYCSRVPGPYGSFKIVERVVPEPENIQVRIKIQACTVLHGDLVTKVELFPNIDYPRVPGHEYRHNRCCRKWRDSMDNSRFFILLTLLSFKSPRLGCHPDYEHRRLHERQGQEVSDKWVEGD